jgi:tetraacyldisaccharide 4'-kinase
MIYGMAIIVWDLYWRNAEKVKLPCKVISVGNITAGGAGKTPLVIYIAKLAIESGRKTAVVARGYKRKKNGLIEVGDNSTWHEVGDEPKEVFDQISDVRVYVHHSKTSGAQKACDDGAEIVIVDDGFQHRRLHRDIDIVCLDWIDPYGPGGLLPSGLLREPVRNLKRADILVFTSFDISHASKIKIKGDWDSYYARSEISAFMNLQTGEIKNSDALRDRKALAFCGLARPDKYFAGLKKTNLNLVGVKAFPDHFHYRQKDIDNLIHTARRGQADCLITTAKDAVKIGGFDFGDCEVYSAMLDIAVIDKEGNEQRAEFKARLGL